MHDEKLILYYFDDGLPDDERRQIAAALESDAALRERYAELRRHLGQFSEPADHAAPPHAVRRWHDSIERAARLESGRKSNAAGTFNVMSFFWGAVVTAALAIGIGIGVFISAGDSVTPVSDDTVVAGSTYPGATVPTAFSRGLEVYLRDSRREISRLPLGSAEDRAFLVTQIIEENRLFERAAEHRNSPGLARVLRAFEPVLVRLASEDLSSQELEALRSQLAFELNAMLTKIQRDASVVEDTI